MFNDISCGSNEKEYPSPMPHLVSLSAKRFGIKTMVISRSWFRERSGILSVTDSPQGEWDRCRWNDDDKIWRKGTPKFSVPRVHCPEERLQEQRPGRKPSIHFAATDGETIETVFRTIISVNQLSLYGAVAAMYEEYETLSRSYGATRCGRTIEFLIRAMIDQDRSAFGLWSPCSQRYFYRNNFENELKSYHNETDWANFVWLRGFLNVVEIGQYFMTKGTAEFSQFTDAVACREYTLPREEEASEPKGWIRGNTKTGPVLEVATCCLNCKYGVEIRIMSMNEDNSHSWVRISHGSSTSWSRIWTTASRKPQKCSSKKIHWNWMQCDFCMPIKGQSKTTKEENLPTLPQELYVLVERTWTDVEPGEYSLSDRDSVEEINSSSSSWKPSTSRTRMERLNSWESKTIFKNISSRIDLIGLTTSGRKPW